jgi:ribonuclease HI
MTQGSGSGKRSVTIYTDGGALGNPGPGGYGAVLLYGEHRKEISGGFRKTTNNRMELLACIEALKALKYPCCVTLHSDSRYVVDGIEKGWAKRWRSKGWMRNKEEAAKNADLWARLLSLCETHKVAFKWVKGHAGDKENERCDALANTTAMQPDLPPDTNYEQGRTGAPART